MDGGRKGSWQKGGGDWNPNPLRGAQGGMVPHREVGDLRTSCIFTSATLFPHQ